MHRTEGQNNVEGLFSDGPPATCVTDDWLNAVQEEIAYAIEQAGVALLGRDTDTRDQLYTAIQNLAAFPSGTIMLFGQSGAPVGWTRKGDWQDNAMICYAAAGAITSGGGVNPQSTHTHDMQNHTHDMKNHTHDMQNHTHDMKNHTHAFTQPDAHGITQPTFTGPNHNHALDVHNTYGSRDTTSSVGYDTADGDKKLTDVGTGGAKTIAWVTANTSSDGTGACTRTQDVVLSNNHSGGAVGVPSDNTSNVPSNNTSNTPSDNTSNVPSNNTSNANTAPYYQEVIVASKD